MIARNQKNVRAQETSIGESPLKTMETNIDGCHVTLRFPSATDESIFANVREILKSAYTKFVS